MKKLNKVLAVLLSLMLAASCAAGTLALAADTSCDCGHDPIIYVIGFASRDLICNQGEEDEMTVFPPDSKALTSIVKNVLTPETLFDIGGFTSTGDYSYLSKVLDKVGFSIFDYIAMNPDGTSKYNVSEKAWSYPTAAELTRHTEGREFEFLYDWRLDPFVVASQLDEYIDYILENTGHDRVNLIGFSLGSCITMTYLTEYGFDKVAGVQLRAPAFNGVSCCGEAFAANIDTDAAALIRIIDVYLEANGTTAILDVLLQALNLCGFLPGTVDVLKTVVDNCIDELYANLTGEIFAFLPGMWALVDDASYEDAKAAMLYGKEGAEEFEKVIDRYHYGVQAHNKETIDKLIAEGHNFSLVVKYGSQLAPATKSYMVQSDATIDTRYESFGATCANYGETLPEDYVQAVDDGHNHISPDNVIDASTGAYPEYTWYVKGLPHPYGCDYIDDLTREIFFADHQTDVFENENYPQFVAVNADSRELEEIETEPEQEDIITRLFAKNDWAKLVIQFIKALIKFVSDLFNK